MNLWQRLTSTVGRWSVAALFLGVLFVSGCRHDHDHDDWHHDHDWDHHDHDDWDHHDR